MAKQLNVNLAFTADTTQAKQQLQQLQQQLNSIISGGTAKQLGFDTEINKGIDAAAKLKLALQEATNASTGKLDLGKFDQQIKKSGMTIKEYGANLAALGPKGQEAFISLARSVSNAEIPLTRVSSKITELGVVLKNTLKWQISSSVLHGFMGAVSTAYQYAQDLNESLNNIRIVTGQSVEQMDKFAEKANKAAKALNATTTEYSNAALIYYQQGLSDDEVLKRTNTTIKLANVSRESAETVSEWMTAIWNNFDDGTRSLESYADTITALGAATASSADEIAEGLEKFSAIAETVGLSYDYATAALATVTSQTRQSADVVGTAFKTLFARLEGLKLGETLEDGVTLNQYSEGLAAVGINILNANGELKDMDTILNQLGSRWDTLSKAQQVALAQTVGGIRQYNQLISLMDNWDTFQQNLTIAQTSEGALQEQADIYAESWEGAQKRVKASAQAIYSDLLNDDFFIDLLNGFSHILDTINSLIDSLGGAKGVLLTVSTLLLQMTGPKIAKGLENMALNMKYFFNPAKAQADAKAIKDDMWKTASIMSTDTGTQAGAAQGAAFKMEADLQRYLLENASKMSEEEQAIYKLRMDNVRALQEANIEHAKAVDLLDKEKELASVETARTTNTGQSATSRLTFEQASFGLKFKDGATGTLEKVHGYADTLLQTSGLGDMNLTDAQARITELKSVFDKLEIEIPKEIQEAEKAINEALANGEKGRVNETSAGGKVKKAENDAREKGRKVRNKMEDSLGKDGLKALDKEIGLRKKATEANNKYSDSTKEVNKAGKELLKSTKQQQNSLHHWSTTVVNVAQGVSSLAMGISTLFGAFKTLNEAAKNGKLGFEEILGVLMSFAMGIPMVINGTKVLGGELKTLSSLLLTKSALTATDAATNLLSKTSHQALTAALKLETAEEQRAQVAKLLGITVDQAAYIIEKKREGMTWKQAIASAFENGIIKKGIAIKALHTAATIAQWVAETLLGGAISTNTALILLMIAAFIGLIAIGSGVVAIIKTISDAYNADAIAAEEAKEKAEDLAKAYDKIKESYNNLKEALTNYQEAQNSIDQLKEGTNEWRDAIQEANQQVLELMETYPELAQYVSNDSGRLIISEAGQQQILKSEQAKLLTVQNTKAQAQLEASFASNKAKETDMVRKELDYFSDAVTIIGTVASALSLSVPAGVNLIQANEDAADTSRAALEAIQEAVNEQGLAFFADYENNLNNLDVEIPPSLMKQLKENKEAIQELTNSNRLLYEQQEILNQQKVDSILNGQEHFVSDYYGEGMQRVAREEYAKMVDEARSTWGTADQYKKGLNVKTNKGEDAFLKWAELNGLDKDKLQIKNFKGSEVVYKEDKDSNRKTVSYKEIEQMLAEYEANKQAFEFANEMNRRSAMIQTLNKGSSSDKAIASFFENDSLDYLSPEDYEKIKNTAVNITTDQANMFGYETVEEAQSAFDKAVDSYKAATAEFNIAARDLERANSILAAGAAELEISETTLRAYAETLQNSSSAMVENKEQAAKMAVSHFRLAKGINGLQKALNENLKILKDSTVNSLDYHEALGAVKESLEAAFGVKVSADFIKNNKNLELMERVAQDDVEALKELKKALVEDYILNLEVEDGKEELLSEMQRLQELAENSPIGTKLTLDNTDAINAINSALKAGTTTVEEIEAMFHNANLAMPEYKTVKVPNVSTSKSVSTITTPKRWGNQESTVETTTSNVSWTTVPYFGDNPPVYEETTASDGTIEYKIKENTGIEKNTGLDTSVMSNGEMDQDILKYQGDEDIESAYDKKKRFKELDNEIERYHEIDEVIEDLERNMDKLSKAKERAFGTSKLDLIQQEIEQQKELISAGEERLRQAEEFINIDRKNILDNYAVELDENGYITNYNKLIQDQIDILKGISDTDSDRYKWESEYLEQMKNDFAEYEETLDTVKDQQQHVIDLQSELSELALEKIEYTVQLKVDIADDDKAYIDFLMQEIEDDAFAAADAISLIGRETEGVLSKIEATQSGISKIMEDIEANGGVMTEDQVNDLREYRDNLIDYNAELLELRQTVQDKLTEAYDAWNEKLDENANVIDHYGSVIEHYKNIIDIVGKDNLGISDETLDQMRRAQVSNANDAVRASKAALDANKEYLASLKEQRANAAATYGEDSIEVAEWDEQIKVAEEKVREATKTFNDSWSNALQVAADAFQDSITQIVETFNESVSGIYKNLEELQEAFDRQTEVNDRYLAQYEKTYEISKLNRQISDSINKTDNVGSQKELRDLQKQLLAMNEEGVEVSQRDIEFMQKKYDLLLAEQALKEAQNAKSVVRLQRDSEGNFGYVYTADQGSVDEARQNYEDKLYEMQKFGDESLLEIQEQIIATNQEFAEAMQAVADDANLSAEEKKAKQEELTAYYTEKLRYWTDEANKFMLNGQEINEQYNTNMASNFSDTLLGQMYPDLNSFEDLYTQSQSAMMTAGEEFIAAEEIWQNDLDTIMTNAGTSVDDFEDTVKTELSLVEQESENTADAIETMASDMKTHLTTAIGHVTSFQTSFGTIMKTVRDNIDTTINKIGDIIEDFNEMDREANEAKSKWEAATGAKNNYNNTITQTPPQTQTPAKQLTITKLGTYDNGYAAVKLSNGKWYTSRSVNSGMGKVGDVANIYPGASDLNIDRIDEAYRFDTGGYTGEWGPEGRIAMLHQKEIVLNAHDTENFLTAIGIVRDISDKLEKNAIGMQYQAALNNFRTMLPSTGDVLEQNVHITAEFPNATDHNEIEEAFRNLANRASQYVYRRR